MAVERGAGDGEWGRQLRQIGHERPPPSLNLIAAAALTLPPPDPRQR